MLRHEHAEEGTSIQHPASRPCVLHAHGLAARRAPLAPPPLIVLVASPLPHVRPSPGSLAARLGRVAVRLLLAFLLCLADRRSSVLLGVGALFSFSLSLLPLLRRRPADGKKGLDSATDSESRREERERHDGSTPTRGEEGGGTTRNTACPPIAAGTVQITFLRRRDELRATSPFTFAFESFARAQRRPLDARSTSSIAPLVSERADSVKSFSGLDSV